MIDESVTPNGVAFTGEVKLGSKGNWLGKRAEALTIRQRVRGPSFPAPFDRISDPQIPLTRQNFQSQIRKRGYM